MQPVMKFFLVHLILIPVSPLTTTFASNVDNVLGSSRINCPLNPYSPISICSAVLEMSPTWYSKYAKQCLHGPRVKTYEKDGNSDHGINPDPRCLGCFCAHFLARFPHEQHRAWILQESWAKGISDRRATRVPSAPLAKGVQDPHTEVSTKGIPEAGSLGLALKKVPEVGWGTAIFMMCLSLGAGFLGMRVEGFLLGQQPTPTAPPDGRLKCKTTGKFIKKGFPCDCGKDCGGDSKKVW